MASRFPSILRLSLLSTIFLGACGSAASLSRPEVSTVVSSASQATMNRLARMLAGSYSSEAQSKRDRSYFDIRLHIEPIWKNRKDGRWFYVEQARADYLDQPYRQRVYHLVDLGKGSFESQILTFADPQPYIGAWKNTAIFEGKDPSMLVSRDGCGVMMAETTPGTFSGGTVGKGCASDINGATYTTSVVNLSTTQLLSWDRGFDAQDRQVWGAVKGGYVFDKISN